MIKTEKYSDHWSAYIDDNQDYKIFESKGMTEKIAIINLARLLEEFINDALEERYMDKYYAR